MSPRSPHALGACALALAVSVAVPVRADVPPPAPGDAAPPPPGASPAPAPGVPPIALPEVEVRLPAAEATADPTAAVTVVSAERFAGEAKQVAELVATAPGVAVSGYGGLGQLATASIRGSTPDGVRVLLDGLPLNTAFGGGVDLSTIPRQWISRLEVVRGPEGALYGAGAMGGALNVVTRRAAAGTWSAEATGGSFGTWSGALDGALGRPGLDLFAAVNAEGTSGRFPYRYDRTPNVPGGETDLTRENNGAARGGGLVKLGAALGRDLRLDGLVQASGGRRELPGPPGPQTAATDWLEDGRGLAMARLSGPAPWDGGGLAGRLHVRLDRLDVRTGSVLLRQRGGAAGALAEASFVRGPGRLQLSAEAEGERLDATGIAGARTRATVAGSAAADLRLAQGRLRVAPAFRLERVGAFTGWSAKLGGTCALGAGLSARASAGRTFRAPSFAELYLTQGLLVANPELTPEEGLAADAGLSAEGRWGMAAATGFTTLYRDLILYDLASLGRLRPRNAGRALVSGLELEAATAPARRLAGLSLSGAYTLLVTENLRDDPASVGKWLPHRARHRLYARAAVAPGPLRAHLEAQYVGRQYLDTRNAEPVAAALVWSAGASVEALRRPAVALGVEVRNALDDRTLTDPLGYPLPGRMVLVTLRAGSTPTEGAP